MIEPLIDAEAAGRLLGVHPKTVKRFAQAGVIPAMRIGKLWRFRASNLDTWTQEQVVSNCNPKHITDTRERGLLQSACHPMPSRKR